MFGIAIDPLRLYATLIPFNHISTKSYISFGNTSNAKAPIFNLIYEAYVAILQDTYMYYNMYASHVG